MTDINRPSWVTEATNNVDRVIAERQSTHGDFTRTAEISQRLKAVFRDNLSAEANFEYTEAMDMIALKLARILSGQSTFEDHWVDIAGYATLAAMACRRRRH